MVTFTAYAAVDFGGLSIFGGFNENADFSTTPTTRDSRFTVIPDPSELPDARLVVTGTDFAYIPGTDVPFAGTIRQATFYDTAGSGPDELLFKIAGLNLTPQEAAGYADQDPFVVANDIFSGADTLTGSTEDDFLCGFGGLDTMTGRGGKDTFYFNAPVGTANYDRITSFNRADDTIGLDHNVFKKLSVEGTLASAHFKDITAGMDLQDSNDRILYNHDTGRVYYDADANGSGALRLFAILENSPIIDQKDFVLY